ncbi:MAG: helix-turn-helix domain-containing protein [Vallitaleaceae bacterium]|nr:helix-turn-helix domain-containing protein [Vallitaleaceae bacterium]
MNLNTSTKYLPIYEALASKVRLSIIDLLAHESLNIKEIAERLDLSNAMITSHIRKLEEAGIIFSERKSTGNAMQKLCHLKLDQLHIQLNRTTSSHQDYHEFSLPVGHYTDFNVTPTCGIATVESVIGRFDDPRYFLDPARVNAQILWFTEGYVEYRVPNYLSANQFPKELAITLELCSEAPGINPHWLSDITFFLNEKSLGTWTSPGDFGGKKGLLTPDWWSLEVGQYGLLKTLRITSEGSFMDQEKISDTTLSDLQISGKYWSFRIAVLKDAPHMGGVTLFGKDFGNHNQDILFRLYYETKET